MVKININTEASKRTKEVVNAGKEAYNKAAARVTATVKPDTYASNTKIVSPFYNKFLPIKFCRIKQIEFHPNTKIPKHVDTFNGYGDLINSKSFDTQGKLIYSEKINPKTDYHKIMHNADGEILNEERQGSVLLKKTVMDKDGKLSYSYEYNPETMRETVNEVHDGTTIITKKVKGEQIYRYYQSPKGEIREEGYNIKQGTRYFYEAGIINFKDGHTSKTPKFKRLTFAYEGINQSTVYEYHPKEQTYSCKIYNEKGAQLGNTTYIDVNQMRTIIDKVFVMNQSL